MANGIDGDSRFSPLDQGGNSHFELPKDRYGRAAFLLGLTVSEKTVGVSENPAVEMPDFSALGLLHAGVVSVGVWEDLHDPRLEKLPDQLQSLYAAYEDFKIDTGFEPVGDFMADVTVLSEQVGNMLVSRDRNARAQYSQGITTGLSYIYSLAGAIH